MDTPDAAIALVPVAPASSLQGDAATAKGLIEGWMGDPRSPYHVGTGEQSAAWIQQHYRDLVRGEQLGAAGAISPMHSPDDDVPPTVEGYNFLAAAGAHSMTAEDRDVVDHFLTAAHAIGLGQAKVRSAIGWCLSIPDITPDQFGDLAIAAGWSDAAIEACLGWYRAEAKRHHQQRKGPP